MGNRVTKSSPDYYIDPRVSDFDTLAHNDKFQPVAYLMKCSLLLQLTACGALLTSPFFTDTSAAPTAEALESARSFPEFACKEAYYDAFDVDAREPYQNCVNKRSWIEELNSSHPIPSRDPASLVAVMLPDEFQYAWRKKSLQEIALELQEKIEEELGGANQNKLRLQITQKAPRLLTQQIEDSLNDLLQPTNTEATASPQRVLKISTELWNLGEVLGLQFRLSWDDLSVDQIQFHKRQEVLLYATITTPIELIQLLRKVPIGWVDAAMWDTNRRSEQ